MPDSNLLPEYVQQIEQTLHTPDRRRYPCQQALIKLLESFARMRVVNDPQRADLGAPELVVLHGHTPVGCIITQEPGADLSLAEQRADLAPYLAALPNLIVTNFIEFHRFVFGEHINTARLGEMKDGKLKRHRDGQDDVGQLLEDFAGQIMLSVRTARDLAAHMGTMARLIRDLIEGSLTAEYAAPDLLAQMQAFREMLIPDLTPQQFADMLAQTITYSLFAARIRHKGAGRSEPFRRKDAFWDMPPTNAFLKQLFDQIAGANLDTRVDWMVDILADLLAHADTLEIMSDFGRRKRQEDPVMRYYEVFLNAYDPQLRDRRGVYYTPEPVVCYIVSSVDYLLRKRFKRRLGLADPETTILDPAVGTGTFLYFVIQHIQDTLRQQRQLGSWDDYVRDYLLPRITGFELLMAPYAITHMKIGFQLQEMGYRFTNNQRLSVFLTNALSQPQDQKQAADFAALIAGEARAASPNTDRPVMVVLGNPPYAYTSANNDAWIGGLVRDYYDLDGEPLGERNAKGLQDDYVKFIRLGQWYVEQSGSGVLAFITNNGYLDNPTFRGMRQKLLDCFSDIYVLNLHGDARKGETTSDGTADQNIFDIQTGVAIGFFVKAPGKSGPAHVHHADVWGQRTNKSDFLLENDLSGTLWTEIHPHHPAYLFIPHDEDLEQEYNSGLKIADIFVSQSTGVTTHRDQFAIDLSREALEARIAKFRNPAYQDEEIRRSYNLRDTQTWHLTDQRQAISAVSDWERYFADYLYRPFDIHHIYYHSSVVNRPRLDVMQHLLAGDNLALCTTRQVIDTFTHVFCTTVPADNCAISPTTRERTHVFPLYLYPGRNRDGDESPFAPGKGGRIPNFDPLFVQTAARRLGMTFLSDGRGDCKHAFGAEDVFAYLYAVLHSPTYRRRYADYLKHDFPRLPLTSDKKLFRSLVSKGRSLIDLHLMHKAHLWKLLTGFSGMGSNEIDSSYPRFTQFAGERGGRVYINETKYFEGLPQAVWEFQVGGYRVLEKWLKDRRGEVLTFEDTLHYQRVAVAIQKTLMLMDEIDEVIASWPIV